MARLSRRETKRRLRLMARATVAMELGAYEWPDGRHPVDSSGKGIVEKKELMRVSGYATSAHDGGRSWFEDPYYLKHVALERANVAAGKDVTAYTPEDTVDGDRVLMVADKLLDILENRLLHDKDKFTTTQLLTFTHTYLKLGLDMLDRDGTEDRRKVEKFTAFLGDTIVQLPGEEDPIEPRRGHYSERMNELREMIDAVVEPDREEELASEPSGVTDAPQHS